ncbi:hypothetical protein AGMMS49960_14680 [Betaproteobacteria bacterium]|nr:hypothetical protein AGMMS49543_20050 [Betaproteobacteria bacterium]GHU02430.1 hypothetical protein AGMMS49960_14680 [Betaproteobacteria bacterium]GHU22089.1 hypothetical protein AGMMS50243_20990 [Betaproteobacteria bacterium]
MRKFPLRNLGVNWELILSEHDNEGLKLAVDENLNPNLLQQLRQLSVPVWARWLALLLALFMTLMPTWLVLSGVSACASECNDHLINAGVSILSVGFVPSLVLVYLVFAETGVKALKSKTRELLENIVLDALHTHAQSDTLIRGENDVLESKAQLLHISGPTAQYSLSVRYNEGLSFLRFHLDFNVKKVNVVIYLPWDEQERGKALTDRLKEKFAATIEGATHEGYVIDENVGYSVAGGKAHVLVCGRKLLRQDFLWDPASKLYFAQDLRLFLFSLIQEAGSLLHQETAQ